MDIDGFLATCGGGGGALRRESRGDSARGGSEGVGEVRVDKVCGVGGISAIPMVVEDSDVRKEEVAES